MAKTLWVRSKSDLQGNTEVLQVLKMDIKTDEREEGSMTITKFSILAVVMDKHGCIFPKDIAGATVLSEDEVNDLASEEEWQPLPVFDRMF